MDVNIYHLESVARKKITIIKKKHRKENGSANATLPNSTRAIAYIFIMSRRKRIYNPLAMAVSCEIDRKMVKYDSPGAPPCLNRSPRPFFLIGTGDFFFEG